MSQHIGNDIEAEWSHELLGQRAGLQSWCYPVSAIFGLAALCLSLLTVMMRAVHFMVVVKKISSTCKKVESYEKHLPSAWNKIFKK